MARPPGPRSSPTLSFSRGWGAKSFACWPTTPHWASSTASICAAPARRRAGGPGEPLAATLGYYVTPARAGPGERQALIKCRPVAGDLDLGRMFCDEIQPFVYRRFLGAAEIAEIKSLKRRIEQRTLSAGTSEVEVKTGHGGIRDIEFVVQFLQLLHGGEYPQVRHSTTLAAIARLEQVGCLSTEERCILDDNYRFLRRVEHRLQISFFDRQTQTRCPATRWPAKPLARGMG